MELWPIQGLLTILYLNMFLIQESAETLDRPLGISMTLGGPRICDNKILVTMKMVELKENVTGPEMPAMQERLKGAMTTTLYSSVVTMKLTYRGMLQPAGTAS